MLVAGHTLAERFELRRRLGSGGMGEVFEAYDRDRGEVIALKTLSRADGDTLTRFKREFRALQSTAHPNLVSLRELVRDGDTWFFTMELVPGAHFLEHIRGKVGARQTRCDVPRLRAALRQLVHGLRALHDGGLVHRDIKPSNVMVTDEGRVVLLDFGLVTTLDPARQSTEGVAVGTVEYMAPEQAVGRKVTEAADWYSVGVMVYEALTGQVPHSGHALQILVEKQQIEPVPPEALAPDAPGDLAALCKSLLKIEPTERPGGAAIAKRLGIDETSAPRVTLSRSMSSERGVFVGRERELAELSASLDRSRERPIVHLVVGESGIGKSELVARFTRTIKEIEPGSLLLTGRCYERESVPYKALDGVADGLAYHLAELSDSDVEALLPPAPALLVRLFPVFMRIQSIASAPMPRDESSEPHEVRRRMFGALRALLAARCAQGRVIISIDDLQWADADSFLLLRELLRGEGAPHVLVLATVRGGAAEADAVAERLAGITIPRTELGPLSDDESRVLAERLIPGVASKVDIAKVAREAHGHPMFLQELLRHLDTLGDDTPTATLDDALWARVALLRPDARALLEAVCLAGAPIAIDVASAACRLDATTVGRAASSLRVAGLAREIQRGRLIALEPYHDRVREAVYGRITEAQRWDGHARLAAALESSGEPRDPQLLLRHFRHAQMPDRAARYAEDAAQRSLDASAFDQAAELWRISLDLVPRNKDDRRRLLLRLGEALVNAGRGAEAADVYLEAAEGADRPTRLDCHRHASEQLLISGRIDRGLKSLDELLAEIGVTVPATPKRALFSLIRHRLQLRLRGLGFEERHRKEITDADVLRLDVLKGAAQGLAMVDSIRGADFQTRQLVFALRSGHRPHIARSLLLEAMYQATNGNLRRALRLIARGDEVHPADQHDQYLTAWFLSARGTVAYFGGDAPTACDLLTQAEEVMRHVPGATWELASMKLFSLFAMRFIGDYAAMRPRYERYAVEAQQRGDQYVDSTMRRACVPMWLADDNPDEAARELERASWIPEHVAFHVQHFHELIARGEIAVYTGEPADVARLHEGFDHLSKSMLLRITSVRTQYEYLRGRLAIAELRDPRAAEKYARQLGRESYRPARVWAHVLRAGAAMLRDERERAAEHLAAAETAATDVGMKLTAAVARRRLAELKGDEALSIAATSDMATLGIRAPAKMTALLVPIGVR